MISVQHYQLQFKKAAKTSRDVLHLRDCWFVQIADADGKIGIGECSPIFGLSLETREVIEQEMQSLQHDDSFFDNWEKRKLQVPSVRFAIEMAEKDLLGGGQRRLFQSSGACRDIRINGLIWMNEKQAMIEEAKQKIAAGFSTVKFKIGGLDFQEELEMLASIRSMYSPEKLEIRLDANGAFSLEEAESKLEQLAKFSIHSIEQPIKAGQWNALGELVKKKIIPIALDEELIGPFDATKKREMLTSILPDYIILKPTLHGGFEGCDEWIEIAKESGIQWWATSALESSLGLNAIAQWVNTHDVKMPQGLGTGALYVNNFVSPWEVHGEHLVFTDRKWDISQLNQLL
jgi:o-succinylbenzoate synthase